MVNSLIAQPDGPEERVSMLKRVIESDEDKFFAGIDDVKTYAEHAKRSMVRYRTFLSRLHALDITGKCLEVGAGPGFLTVEVARNHLDVQITALEVLPDMVTVGRGYVAEQALDSRIEFVEGDVEDEQLVRALGEFDLVYTTYSLHHWTHADKALVNLHGAVAQGGVLYIFDLRRVCWLYWIPIKNGFFRSIRALYMPHEIDALLKKLGLQGTTVQREFAFMQSIVVRK
jgi:SAM-dependent methyltransferase